MFPEVTLGFHRDTVPCDTHMDTHTKQVNSFLVVVVHLCDRVESKDLKSNYPGEPSKTLSESRRWTGGIL